MISLVGTVHHIVDDLAPAGRALPSLLSLGAAGIAKVHGIWRLYRYSELYRQPASLVGMIGGHVAQEELQKLFWIGPSIALATQCVHVALRIIISLKHKKKLGDAWQKLERAWHGRYAAVIELPWVKQAAYSWLSPSLEYAIRYQMSKLLQQAASIFRCAIKVLRHLFSLSMSLIDIVDAIYCKAPFNSAGMAAGEALQLLSDNSEPLLSSFERHKSVIERLLEKSPISYLHLFGCVRQAASQVPRVHQWTKSDQYRDAVYYGKRLIGSIFVMMEAAEFRPHSLNCI